MKIRFWIFNLVILILMGSCSFINKVTILKEKKSENWEKSVVCQTTKAYQGRMKYNYRYLKSQKNNLSIYVCPSLYSFSFSFGPPIVPIIPSPALLFPRHWEEHPFFVDIILENFNDKNVDLNTIEFYFNSQKEEIKPDRIINIKEGFERYSDNVYINPEPEKIKITNMNYTVEGNLVKLRCYFNVQRNKVHKLTLSFDKFKVNENIEPFPRLNYVKRCRFLYSPLVIAS